MRASVIIPSYNAEERLYYNLLSLNNQDYNFDDFEVIAVDNGSKDNTFEMLKNFKSKYILKVVKLEKNRGIARGRNAAIKNAEGEILIFHDSDMIAPRDFICNHIKAHEESNIVVCGMSWRRVYTYFYKDFSPDVLNTFESLREKYNLNDNYIIRDKYQLLKEKDIIDGNYINYAFDLKNDFIDSFRTVIDKYGVDLQGYNIPWRFFLTNNASVERQKVIDVGIFDEKIIGYGYEDYDLGVRLFKSGCKFIFGNNIISVHQEHPSNARYNELNQNTIYMCEKYNNIYFIDMVLICVVDRTTINKDSLNGLMDDINKMIPLESFKWILELFLGILQIIKNYYYKTSSHNDVVIITNIQKNVNYIMKEALMLKEKFGLVNFSSALLSLLNDINSIL